MRTKILRQNHFGAGEIERGGQLRQADGASAAMTGIIAVGPSCDARDSSQIISPRASRSSP